jgi:hypothetical protein
MSSFEKLQADFGISEVYYFYEFQSELIKQLDTDLIFCDQFWVKMFATRLIEEYKLEEKTFSELVLDIDPPPGVTSGDWWEILNTFWNLK